MNDFFEIDFLSIEADKSGDAITIRYRKDNKKEIHIVDGGFQKTGEKIVDHIQTYYGTKRIDRVIVTHNDSDHTKGLSYVLENCDVGELWMLKPWDYADELISHFTRFSNIDNLKDRLRECYSNIDALEKIAIEKSIPIFAPFQGKKIGEFTVLAPSKERYLELIIQSEKTPPTKCNQNDISFFSSSLGSVMGFVKAKWGEENLSKEPTSAENNMSIIQYAELRGKKILLTGDAGVETLEEAKSYLREIMGISLPGIDCFQVPHHGSRRNISSQLLNDICGEKLPISEKGMHKFVAVISASKGDKNHPRKAVLRALIHRGAKVITTEGKTICYHSNAPQRNGWGAVMPVEYPEDQED